MQNYTAIEHPEVSIYISKGKAQIPQYPCGHADQQHFFNTDAVKQKGYGQDKDSFGNLAQDHFTGCVLHTRLVQEQIGKAKIK